MSKNAKEGSLTAAESSPDKKARHLRMNITPILVFNGNCNQAIDFYLETFQGKLLERHLGSTSPNEDEDWHEKVKHAVIEVNFGTFFLRDREKNDCLNEGNNMLLSVCFDNTHDAGEIFKTLAAEGYVYMPFENQFWVGILCSCKCAALILRIVGSYLWRRQG
jgi:PhnB protein